MHRYSFTSSWQSSPHHHHHHHHDHRHLQQGGSLTATATDSRAYLCKMKSKSWSQLPLLNGATPSTQTTTTTTTSNVFHVKCKRLDAISYANINYCANNEYTETLWNFYKVEIHIIVVLIVVPRRWCEAAFTRAFVFMPKIKAMLRYKHTHTLSQSDSQSAKTIDKYGWNCEYWIALMDIEFAVWLNSKNIHWQGKNI